MKIRVVGSSSRGNCLILESKAGVLLLDAGLPFKAIQKALEYDLSGTVGALITHEHKDHCKAVQELLSRGINCFMSQGTAEMSNTSGHRLNIVSKHQQFDIGGFTVLPFDVEHDAEEPLGYLIVDNLSAEKLCFMTDSYYCRYTFRNVDYYVVECNYCEDILEENIAARVILKSQAARVTKSHFSLENLKKFFKGKRLIQKVVLIHLSDSNSDERRMIEEIQSVVGCKVEAAGTGKVIELGLQF